MTSHGSYLKGDSGKYYAGHAITTSFDVIEATSLPMATLAQHAFIQACTLAKDKTANIYTDSRYAFGVVHDFGMFLKQCGFLTFSGNKIKNGPYVQ